MNTKFYDKNLFHVYFIYSYIKENELKKIEVIDIDKIKITRDNFEEQVEFFKGTVFNPTKDSYDNINYTCKEGYVGRIPYYTDIIIKTDNNEVIIVDINVFNYLDYYFKNEVDLEDKIAKGIEDKIDILNVLRIANNIYLGDVVSLKSGSMLMTVKDIVGLDIVCEYYLNDKFETATFKVHQLKLER